MSGSTVLITGASAGIGRATARHLAGTGARLILACRSPERTRPLLDELVSADVHFVKLDLASLESVRLAVREIASLGRGVDVMVNNAGVAGRRGITEDGFELAFGVNHVGHAALTLGLFDAVGPADRVIAVSSNAHFRSPGIDWPALRRKTSTLTGMPEYATSKLANVLFARQLAVRHPEVVSVALHPGVVATDIWKRVPAIVRPLVTRKLLTPEEGASTSVHCVTAEGVVSGAYYESSAVREPSDVAGDEELAARLWRETERWVG